MSDSSKLTWPKRREDMWAACLTKILYFSTILTHLQAIYWNPLKSKSQVTECFYKSYQTLPQFTFKLWNNEKFKAAGKATVLNDERLMRTLGCECFFEMSNSACSKIFGLRSQKQLLVGLVGLPRLQGGLVVARSSQEIRIRASLCSWSQQVPESNLHHDRSHWPAEWVHFTVAALTTCNDYWLPIKLSLALTNSTA